jgi:GntR family transcriptional regulator / MocR family aminotransferase
MKEASGPIDLLLSLNRDGSATLGAQIEDQIRRAVRHGMLKPGSRVPSMRDLARQLGVSRKVVADAYAQLAAEGYLTLRQGARPHISRTLAGSAAPAVEAVPAPARARYDFRPSTPDVSTFPRASWLRSLRTALATMTDADLGYGDPGGVAVLRTALADYLGRVRGVAAAPEHIVVTSGFWQGLGLVCRALAETGARRIAFEDPSHPEPRSIATHAGLAVVPVEVDDGGVRVDALVSAGAHAVVLTPAHEDPAGAVLEGERRAALVAWLRASGAFAIEDDYDAEYRYDRAAVGALQGLDPDHVIYAGSTSKTLAPALRLGWLVVPPSLLEAVTDAKRLADQGSPRIDQFAFADFLARGELDRHLRRMRARYRARRDVMVAALAGALPEATVRGIAAGLHAIVELPAGDDEQAIRDEARQRGIALAILDSYRIDPRHRSPTLLLGYGQVSEPAIQAGISELAAAVHTARARLS